MKISKKIARAFFFPFVIHSGLEKYIRNSSDNSTLNLVYHGIVKKDTSYYTLRHLTAEQFEKQLQYFKKYFDVISVNEAFERYRRGEKNRKKTLTITFDDGYMNNLTNALPLLEKYMLKATFFVSGIVAHESNHLLYSDVIDALNYFYKDEIIEMEGLQIKNGFLIDDGKDFIEFLKHKNTSERERILNGLTDKYNIKTKIKALDKEIWELLDKESLNKLAESAYVDIGSHGFMHYNMGLIDLKDAEEELEKSKNILEKATGKKIDMIAYPDGCYTKLVKDAAEQLGYDKQLAVGYRCEDDFDDIRILQRHGISSTTTFESNMFFLNKAFKTRGYN